MAYELYYWPTIQGRGGFVRLALAEAGAAYTAVVRQPDENGGGGGGTGSCASHSPPPDSIWTRTISPHLIVGGPKHRHPPAARWTLARRKNYYKVATANKCSSCSAIVYTNRASAKVSFAVVAYMYMVRASFSKTYARRNAQPHEESKPILHLGQPVARREKCARDHDTKSHVSADLFTMFTMFTLKSSSWLA